MRISKLNIKANWFRVSIISVICLISIFGFLIVREINTFKANVEFFENQFLEERKKDLEREVSNRIDEIDYELTVLEAKYMEVIKERINHMEYMINSEILVQSENLSRNDVIELTMDVIIDHAEHDQEYLFFSLAMDGTIYLSGTNKNLEGTNIIGIKDITGKYFVKEIVDQVKADGEAYVTYYWPKVTDGEPLLKTAYCRYIESVDLIVGTGVYFEDMDKQLQEDIFKRFQAYYEGESDYIFVITYDGIAKVFGDSEMINKDIKDIKDIDGSSIFDSSMKVIRKEGSGFLKYYYYERDTDKKSQKIVYIKEIDEWEVYIGLGFHLDKFYEETQMFEEKSKQELRLHLSIFIVVFIVLVGVLIYFIARAIDTSKKYFKQEEMLYEKFSNLTTEGILITDEKGIIHFANPVAKKLLEISDTDFGIYNKSRFLVDDGEHMKVIGLSGHSAYVEIYSDTIFYKGRDFIVLFLTDTTDRYNYQKNLEIAATTDALTGLMNRRKFLEDFHSSIELHRKEDASFCMALIDLDKFKNINDTYGHDVGDQVLRTFAKLFNKITRESDILYRIGGEEFVVILKSSPLAESKALLERINTNLMNYEWTQDGLKISYTAGLISVDAKDPRELDYYLKKMDKLLYKGKNSGRKRVEI